MQTDSYIAKSVILQSLSCTRYWIYSTLILLRGKQTFNKCPDQLINKLLELTA